MNYLDIIKFRHACKIFDENKKIPKDQMEFILEAGRLSPSSLGLEHWDFIVISNKKLLEDLYPKCCNQAQITSCSHLIVILAKISEIKSQSKYVENSLGRRAKDNPEKLPKILQIYRKFLLENFKDDDGLIFNWSRAQCMFAALNMMNAAASLGIDSCPIEGFQRDEVGKILNIDTTKHKVAILIPFGYRINQQSQKLRREIGEIVTWIE